jgi:hypothetical protein
VPIAGWSWKRLHGGIITSRIAWIAMRKVNNLADAEIILKELSQWKDRLNSKNQDFKGLKIQNAGAATEPNDYVILSQVQQLVTPSITQDQHFSIPFSTSGPVSIGQLSAPFIVGTDRVGNPSSISVAVPAVAQAPTSGPLTINLAMNGTNLLVDNLVLPVGMEGPVSSSAFVSPLPKLAAGNKLVPVIITAGGASFITIQLYVTRILT